MDAHRHNYVEFFLLNQDTTCHVTPQSLSFSHPFLTPAPIPALPVDTDCTVLCTDFMRIVLVSSTGQFVKGVDFLLPLPINVT